MALLASPRRREILRLVWRDERPAGEIHRALGDVTFGAVSQQLATLAAAGLVAMRRDGRRRLYLARRDELGPVAATLEAIWDDALYRLKLHAELDESRRGPLPRTIHRRRRRLPRRSGDPK
jgi:DNA-binding transcriptional ArsR family regulator